MLLQCKWESIAFTKTANIKTMAPSSSHHVQVHSQQDVTRRQVRLLNTGAENEVALYVSVGPRFGYPQTMPLLPVSTAGLLFGLIKTEHKFSLLFAHLGCVARTLFNFNLLICFVSNVSLTASCVQDSVQDIGGIVC